MQNFFLTFILLELLSFFQLASFAAVHVPSGLIPQTKTAKYVENARRLDDIKEIQAAPVKGAGTTGYFCTPPEVTISDMTATGDINPNLYQLTNESVQDIQPVLEEEIDLLGTNSDSLKDYIVRKHNCLRSQQDAANMLELQWNDEVAKQAQAWADNCVYEHNDEADRTTSQFPCGQNLASSTGGAISWNRVINLWYNEINQFVFNGSNTDEMVGHYTQLAWATSWQLGCGYKLCGSFHLYVCHYGPRGNVFNKDTGNLNPPYIPGHACSSCPKACGHDQLCAQGCPWIDYYSNCESLINRRSFCQTMMGRSCQASCSCKGTSMIF